MKEYLTIGQWRRPFETSIRKEIFYIVTPEMEFSPSFNTSIRPGRFKGSSREFSFEVRGRMIKTLKVRLYPNRQLRILLEKHFGTYRFVYNRFLEVRTK
ncbi:MAG: helix-turn-helix domain-containing protein [Conexivisphaerales archaeon]